MKMTVRLAEQRRSSRCLMVAFSVGMVFVAAPRSASAGYFEAAKPDSRPTIIGSVQPPRPFGVADDGQPPETPVVEAPTAPAPSAAPSPSDRIAQENMFWESAQKSNTLADYKAYLDTFPNGVYAPLAKNRIATMTPAASQPQNPSAPNPPPNQTTMNPPQQDSPQENPSQRSDLVGPGGMQPQQPQSELVGPGGMQPQQPQSELVGPGGMQPGIQPPTSPAPTVSPEALRTEIGTLETEQSLNLNRRDAMVLQQRLSASGLYSGPIDGDLGPGSRAAIAAWQQQHGSAPTGQLGPLQYTAIQSEGGPIDGQRADGRVCPPGFHTGPYGHRCWVNR
jgi:putative peptidoglycan binding protein